MTPPPPGSRAAPYGRLLLLCVVALGLAVWGYWRRPASSSPTMPPARSGPGGALSREDLAAFTALEREAREADDTTWWMERRAEARAVWVETLWERLNAGPDGLMLLGEALSGRLTAPAPTGPSEVLPHGILRHRGDDAPSRDLRGTASPTQGLDPVAWLRRAHAEGWRLLQSEWRHWEFRPAGMAPAGDTDFSRFEVHLDLVRSSPAGSGRAQIRAQVRFDWPSDKTPGAEPVALRAETWEVLLRNSDPPFVPVLLREIEPFPRTQWVDPLIVDDLDHDGRPELMLCARNLVFRRDAGGNWREEPLCERHPGLIFTAVLGDISGDGIADLLMAMRSGLVLVRGDAEGRFRGAPELVWAAPARLEYAQALTCGDMDGDGDLDVFLGQYRTPYSGGQMPQPYFDANDGYPSYLLRNEGGASFVDATAGSGLESRRFRRSYGASFADLEEDGDLDLVVTSDFAGMEVHSNDGRGRFRDMGGEALASARGFGMSHAFGDFNADGRLDLLFMAMPQPTADRLIALGLERPGHEAWLSERPRMVAGNRLFLGMEGGYRAVRMEPALARTGWAWSAAAVDLDLDRLPDLHIVNGHETRSSVRDYESEFWTHDIYLPSSTPPAAAEAFFASRYAATRARGWSYGGWDRNRLLLNRGPGGFLEVGHLFGVAMVEDSRNVLAVDVDEDGDEDLVVTTFEVWPHGRQTLRIFENRLETAGRHWIGFRLPQGPGAPSPIGTRVRIRDAAGSQVRTVTTGDGYRSQSGPVVRFGLGEIHQVDEVEIRYPGGRTWRWSPGTNVDRVHALPPPRG